ncbi:MAG: pyridoxamine 5'-phosphate oxidase family protein [Candidatus Dormibacteraceae bacterium]
MPRKMTATEREAYLAALHVGIISIEAGSGRAPLAVPIWYAYEPGGLVTVLTGATTEKAKLIAAAGRFSLTVQDEAPAYKYATASGPVVDIVELATPAERLVLAQRYLGTEGGAAYVEATGPHPNSAIRMRPESWRTSDYSED